MAAVTMNVEGAVTINVAPGSNVTINNPPAGPDHPAAGPDHPAAGPPEDFEVFMQNFNVDDFLAIGEEEEVVPPLPNLNPMNYNIGEVMQRSETHFLCLDEVLFLLQNNLIPLAHIIHNQPTTGIFCYLSVMYKRFQDGHQALSHRYLNRVHQGIPVERVRTIAHHPTNPALQVHRNRYMIGNADAFIVHYLSLPAPPAP